MLIDLVEEGFNRENAWFVDLYVRSSNTTAINMYKRMGYSVYRRVVNYYSSDSGGESEDAFDMRKSLNRDKDRQHIRENGEDCKVLPKDVF